MRFETELHDYEVEPLLDRLLQITGDPPWFKKFEALQEHLDQNEFLGPYQVEHHGLELKFRELLGQYERSGVFPLKVQDPQQYELYAFAAGVVRIHDLLSHVGKNRLRGMLLDGLKPDNNLLSLQHEITTAVHLTRIGFDLDFNDIESGSGVDFIARRDGAELEVECKMVSADLGRQIHRKKALALHHHLAPTIARVYESAKTGILIRITIPDRLTSQKSQLEEIREAVSIGVVNGASVTRTAACEVEVRDFPIAGSPFEVAGPADISRAALQDFLLSKLGRTNREQMFMFSPKKKAVATVVESAKADQVLKGLDRQLREASRQFTKTRPGHIAVQLHDLAGEEMEELAKDIASSFGKATGLQRMTSTVLGSCNRTHIHSISYRSHGSFAKHLQLGDYMQKGIVSYIRNPSNPHYGDLRLRPLGEL